MASDTSLYPKRKNSRQQSEDMNAAYRLSKNYITRCVNGTSGISTSKQPAPQINYYKELRGGIKTPGTVSMAAASNAAGGGGEAAPSSSRKMIS